MHRNLFFDKVKLCRSATSLNTRLQRWCFLVNFAKFVRTPFSQNSTGRLLLIMAVSIAVKGEFANETVNYDTKTKAYVPISAISISFLKKAKFEQVLEAIVCRFSSKQLFLKFCKFHWKTFVLETLFNKVAILKALIIRDFNTGVFL